VTIEALLSGGPEDGKRIVTEGDTICASFMWPLKFSPARPPKPSWWRHPRAYLRWRRWKPEIPPEPRMDLLTWRRTSEVRDGAVVYELTSPWEPWRVPVEAELGASDAEITRAFVIASGRAHPLVRQDKHTHWVMGPEWYRRMRQIAVPALPSPDLEPAMLGTPITVQPVIVGKNGQRPYLENVTRPDGWPGW
jgi:hypothetical protein